MRQVQSPVIPVVGELIKAHPGTISLGQGVVHYGPPRQAFEQIECFAADPENHKYKLVQGVPALLDALTQKLACENGIGLGASNALLVTAGGNMAFMNAILAITDPGDEVILPLPYYFNHEMAIVMAGCKPVLVPTDENYQLCPDALRSAITPRTRAIVTVSPNNPTGAVYPESALRGVNEICRQRQIYHISDEAYEYFVFAAPSAQSRKPIHFSPASIAGSAGHTISLFSLSKAYGFASWRIGYMVVPEHLATSVKKIQDTLLICAPVISQFAAVGALAAGRDYCAAHLAGIAEVREIFLSELETIRSFCVVPPADGAFYFVLHVDTPLEPMSLIERLVREHGVAAIPGTAFGIHQGCFIRVAYGALPREKAAEGIGRLVRGLKCIVNTPR
ncbi:MAG: pyridoxal phosphate-dependent aminotransferase [Verrucomicrobiales bacterium]|nr:pyridoxal phosphate-dependent aminotransferase [Verrucomicrobiales bacterium]